MMGIEPTEKSSEKKVQTRSEKEKQREYWRRKKAESRARRSSQKHRRYKEKDRNYRQDRRNESQPVQRSRGMKNLPTDPEKCVNVLKNIIEKATPTMLELLKQKQLWNTPKSTKKLSFYEQSSQVLKKSFPAKRNDKVKKTISQEVPAK